MAIVTIPGAVSDHSGVRINAHDSSVLNGFFADSFNELMGQDGTTDDDGLFSTQTLSDTADSGGLFSTQMQADTISAAGNGPTTTLTVDGSLRFLGGAGSSQTTTGSNATILGVAHTTYNYGGADTGGTMTFLTTDNGRLQPENILFDASKSQKALNAFAGLGDTIKGGSYANTITVQNTVNGGNGGADLYSGGDGSQNLFQFLNNKGGQYTIHDFQHSAGNKIGLKADDGQISDMLEHEQQTVKGANGETDTIVKLPNDQGQITFQNLNQLNPKDFQKF